MKMKYYLLLIFIVFSHSLSARQAFPAAEVEYYVLSEKEIAPTSETKAEVIALQDAILSAEIEGNVEDVVLVGTRVEKGQIIARINRDRLSWQLKRRQAELASLQADLKFRMSEVSRFQALASKDNASKTQLQRELSVTEMLKQQIIQAQTNVQEAQFELEKTQIKAPYSGLITEQHTKMGEFIRLGMPIVRLVDLTLKDVVVPVPMSAMSHVDKSMRLTVTTSVDNYTLPIREILPLGDITSRTFEIRINANNSDLIIGDSVSVSIPKNKASRQLLVPRDALVIRNGENYIYVLDANDQATQIAAKIKYAVDNWLVLDAALSSGDKVIVRGAERLQPSAQVNAKRSDRY